MKMYYVVKRPRYAGPDKVVPDQDLVTSKWSIDQEFEEPSKANERLMMLMAGGYYDVDLIITEAPDQPNLDNRE
jgi:hypothetical protein